MTFEMKMIREPLQVPAGYETPMYGDPPSLYRLNDNGMRLTLEAMDAAGCLQWLDAPDLVSPPPPGLAPAGLEPSLDGIFVLGGQELRPVEPAETARVEDDDPRTREMAAMREKYFEMNDFILACDTVRDGRVASYKWQTNDGWLVTPGECRAIASALRRSLDDVVGRLFPTRFQSVQNGHRWLERWTTFHDLAAEHGGYRVY